MAKINLPDIGSLGNSSSARQAINDNFQSIEDAINNTISRDGSLPNSMAAELDMDENKVINVADPEADLDAVNKRSVKTLVDLYAGQIAETVVAATARVDRFVATSGQTTFVLTDAPANSKSTIVTDTGIMLIPDVDYSINGTSLIFTTGRLVGAEIVARYQLLAPSDGILRGDLSATASGKGADLVAYSEGGTGSSTRTVAGKLSERVSILDFIPAAQHAAIRARTSTYDCLASINAAVTELTAQGGGELYFPPGIYKVSDSIVVEADNIRFTGAGRAYHREGKDNIRATATSCITWAGAASPPADTAVVVFQAFHGGAVAVNNGLFNLTIDGNMQAPVGLRIAGSNFGNYTNVTVMFCTTACYDFTAPKYALAAGFPGQSQFNHFNNCMALNYAYDGGTGSYYDNTCKGFRFRQDTTIQDNNGALESCTFIGCRAYLSRGVSFWIESVGQNTYISCWGGCLHPSGPSGGYNCVLGSTDQDSDPGIALWGKTPGAARYSVFLMCEISIVAKASTSASGGGAFGNIVWGKSMGNISPAPVIEKGAAGSNPPTLSYHTLGSRADASETRFGGALVLASEDSGSPMGAGPYLYLNKRSDVGVAGQALGVIQWRMTNSAGTTGVLAGQLTASVTAATAGSETVRISCNPLVGGDQTETAMAWQNGVIVPSSTGGTSLAFQGMGSVNLNDSLYVDNVKVVTNRVTGWNAPSGTQTRGTFNSGTATLAQTAQAVAALIADLRTHGLIGT